MGKMLDNCQMIPVAHDVAYERSLWDKAKTLIRAVSVKTTRQLDGDGFFRSETLCQRQGRLRCDSNLAEKAAR